MQNLSQMNILDINVFAKLTLAWKIAVDTCSTNLLSTS